MFSSSKFTKQIMTCIQKCVKFINSNGFIFTVLIIVWFKWWKYWFLSNKWNALLKRRLKLNCIQHVQCYIGTQVQLYDNRNNVNIIPEKGRLKCNLILCLFPRWWNHLNIQCSKCNHCTWLPLSGSDLYTADTHALY